MKRWQRRTRIVTDAFERDVARDASSACEIYVGECQDCRKRLYYRWIRNSHWKFFTRDVIRDDSSRLLKTLRADSESRFLANKIFSAASAFRRFAVSQTRIFCQLPALIRDRDFSDSPSPHPPTTPVRASTTTNIFVLERRRGSSPTPRNGPSGDAR